MTRAIHIIILLIIISLPLQGQTLNVKKVTSPIAVDGIPDEPVWEISTELESQYSENTAYFGVLWDDIYLYIGVNVTDDFLANKGRQGWYDDGIEICIDGDNDNNTTRLTEEERHFVKVVRSYWLQEATGSYDGVKSQFVETDEGYSMEFAIPWSNIGVTPSVDAVMGFNIGVNDVDELPGQTTLTWTSGGVFWYPVNYAEIILSGETASVSDSYIALIEPNGGDFLINGQDEVIRWKANNVNAIDISYSTDNGITWSTLASDFDASDEYYEFNAALPVSQTCRIKISDSDDSSVNDISYNTFYVSEALTPVEPNIKATWQNYQWPYNAYYPITGDNEHFGNACGPSSLARIIQMWEFPRKGSGYTKWYLSRVGWIEADFENTYYDFDNMPTNLPSNATEEEYSASATLVYHTQASMEDNANTGRDLDAMSYALSNYFNYKESQPVFRNDLTKAEWMQLLVDELDAGRTILITGMQRESYGTWHTNNSILGHWWHVDGYNEKGEFHTVLGFGNYQYDGYYDADSLSQYLANQGILVGLEPDLEGKTLQLVSFNTGEQFVGGSTQSISWNSESVNYIDIEYTTNNGAEWHLVAENVAASTGSYQWTLPEISSMQCKVRLTDSDNINVYDKSDEVFSILAYSVTLIGPTGGEDLVRGDKKLISWENTLVEYLDIEYSLNGGSDWQTIAAGVPGGNGEYLWNVPDENSDNCMIRLSDSQNGDVNSVSNTPFNIVSANYLGGPYKNDDNTVLLLHFENDCFNQSVHSDIPANQSGHEFSDNSVEGMGKSIELNSPLVIPDCDALDLTGDWTIELWFKPTSYNNILQYLIQKPGDNDPYFSNYSVQLNPYWENILYSFYFSGDNRIGVRGIKPDLNKWYHLAFIRDTQTSTIKYILRNADRSEVASMTASYNPGSPRVSAKDLLIGQDFNGLIDEVRISNVVRSYTNNLAANFFAAPVSGQAPLKVKFNNSSTGNPQKWEWDFDNDGTIESTEENPEWTYTEPGVYSVSLKVTSDVFGTDVNVRSNLINVKKAAGIPVITAKIPLENELTIRHIDRVNFSVTANDTTGYDLEYDWYIDRTQVTNNKSQYSYEPDKEKPFPRTDTIKVIVTNNYNEAEVLWFVHTDIVAGIPEITACFPENPDTTLEVKENVELSVEATDTTGLSLEYSWFLNGAEKNITKSVYSYTAENYPALPRTDSVKVVISNGTHDTEMEWHIFIDKINGLDFDELPTEFSLDLNYPNPFNPSTKIKFSIPIADGGKQIVHTTLKVYDMLGNEVASLVDGPLDSGYHDVNFNASNLASGIYIYRITAGEFTASRKMILLK